MNDDQRLDVVVCGFGFLCENHVLVKNIIDIVLKSSAQLLVMKIDLLNFLYHKKSLKHTSEWAFVWKTTMKIPKKINEGHNGIALFFGWVTTNSI